MTKFRSNRKKFLQSIAENERQSGVKDKYLIRDLSEHQVLGVLWNIDDDAFGFRVALKIKPMIGKGVISVLSSVYD